MKKEKIDIDKIQDLIFSFAEGNFSKKGEISSLRNDTDTVIAGINMLGEELKSITVSRDYFSSIYNAISDLLIVINNEGKILKINNAVKNKLNNNEDKIIGESILIFFKEKEKLSQTLKSFKSEKDSYSFETIVSFGNVEFPVRCSISKIKEKDDSIAGYLIIASDISFEKQVEKEILNTIISTEEKEKTRIAYDLHDSLGQELTAIKVYFDIALRSQEDMSKFKSVVYDCKRLIDKSIDSVRAIAKDLMPKTLEDGELFYALYELSMSFSNLVDVKLRLPETEYRIPIDIKVKIYRIIQEFYSNTLKHAKASEIELTSSSTKDRCYFFIKDNGCGFDKSKSKSGNGVKNIEARLKALNAIYNFSSTINKGTELRFEISI